MSGDLPNEAFRPWLLRQISACARRAVEDATKKSREYHGQTQLLLQGILAEYDRRKEAAVLRPSEDWQPIADLRESLRSRLLFGSFDEPLDESGLRIVRVILSRLEER